MCGTADPLIHQEVRLAQWYSARTCYRKVAGSSPMPDFCITKGGVAHQACAHYIFGFSVDLARKLLGYFSHIILQCFRVPCPPRIEAPGGGGPVEVECSPHPLFCVLLFEIKVRSGFKVRSGVKVRSWVKVRLRLGGQWSKVM